MSEAQLQLQTPQMAQIIDLALFIQTDVSAAERILTPEQSPLEDMQHTGDAGKLPVCCCVPAQN